MKELKKYFEHYQTLFPELSSFMQFVKAVKQVKPNTRVMRNGFRKLVDRSDYSKSDINQIFEWLGNLSASK
jgi:hypothetical protein